mgnify:CR=1 FL=1
MDQTDTPPRKRGRPPKDRSAPDAPRQRMMRAGLAILTEKGFSAVGIEEILAAAGVPKGSFYYDFESKDAFGLALIEAYASYFAQKLDRAFLDDSRAPLARLGAFVEDACAGMARFGFRRGCLVGNLGQEMGVLSEPFRAALIAVLHDWEARTERLFRAAQAAGEIAPGADPARLAAAFWIGWEGAVLRAKLERRAAPLEIFAEEFTTRLRAD